MNDEPKEHEHHSTEQDLRQFRVAKMERLRARGDEPYKYLFARTDKLDTIRVRYEALEAGAAEAETPELADQAVAGRIVALRDQGKSVWLDLRDDSGKIQAFIGKKQIGEEVFATLSDLDIGDFIGVHGKVHRTMRGELTVWAERFTLLTKSLRPAVIKHHGLKDVETRYRQRYLDMVANPETLDVFKKRIRVIAAMRSFLTARGFYEVETPMLHPIPGGATARPFITHHNTYDRDFYLRIAPE